MSEWLIITVVTAAVAAGFCWLAWRFMAPDPGAHSRSFGPPKPSWLAELGRGDEDAETLIWLAALHDPQPEAAEEHVIETVETTLDPYDPDSPWPGHDTGWFAAIPVGGLAEGQDDPGMIQRLNGISATLTARYGGQ